MDRGPLNEDSWVGARIGGAAAEDGRPPAMTWLPPPAPSTAASSTGSSNYQLPLGGLEMLAKEVGTSSWVSHDLTWASRTSPQSLGLGLVEQTGMPGDTLEHTSHPSKIRRLEDRSGPEFMNSYSISSKPSLAQTTGTYSLSVSQRIGVDGVQHSEKQMPQLTPEVESALLQQVLNLTPEQLSSLPVEQQQQVLQLQQMLSMSR